MKVIPLNINIPSEDCDPADPSTWDDCIPVEELSFLEEAIISQLLRSLNIGPNIHNSWVCDDVSAPILREFAHKKTIKIGIIVADKMDITIAAYKQQYPESFRQNQQKIRELTEELVRKFFNTGYIDSDFHDENLMLNLNPTDYSVNQVKIVDFGEARIDRRFTVDKQLQVIQNTINSI